MPINCLWHDIFVRRRHISSYSCALVCVGICARLLNRYASRWLFVCFITESPLVCARRLCWNTAITRTHTHTRARTPQEAFCRCVVVGIFCSYLVTYFSFAPFRSLVPLLQHTHTHTHTLATRRSFLSVRLAGRSVTCRLAIEVLGIEIQFVPCRTPIRFAKKEISKFSNFCVK